MISIYWMYEMDVHSEQNKEIIEQRRRNRIASRRAYGEGRALKVADIEAEITAKGTQLDRNVQGEYTLLCILL
jgi:hypothetical protein